MATTIDGPRLPVEVILQIVHEVVHIRDLCNVRLVCRVIDNEVQPLVNRRLWIYSQPATQFPPLAAFKHFFANKARAVNVQRLSVWVDTWIVEATRQALDAFVNLKDLTLNMARWGHPTMFVDVLPPSPLFRLDGFQTNYAYGDPALRSFLVGQSATLKRLGTLTLSHPYITSSRAPFLNAMSSSSRQVAQYISIYPQITHLKADVTLGYILDGIVPHQSGFGRYIKSLWIKSWPPLDGLSSTFPNLEYLEVQYHPYPRDYKRYDGYNPNHLFALYPPRNYVSPLNCLVRIRLPWTPVMSPFIKDTFIWFPSLRVLEVLDYEDVYIIQTYTRSVGGEGLEVNSTTELADPLQWSKIS